MTLEVIEIECAGKLLAHNRFAGTPAVDDAVTVLPIKGAPKIFVQVGAFTRYDNANRLRARLSSIGAAKIIQVRVVDRPFFRVRFGPLDLVEEADRLLTSILGAGQRDARIVVE